MANYRFFLDYILHYCTAKNRHGVHSPFVYQLIDEVIYDFERKGYVDKIEQERQALLQDNQEITVTDLGAGSTLNKNKQKKIKTIAKNALKPKRIAQLLARLNHYFMPHTLIELGTCLGITTAYLSEASPNTHIVTVEGCPETAKIAKRTFSHLQLSQVDLKTGNFDTVLPELLAIHPTLDLLFLDGNHRKEATLRYFQNCLPNAHEGSVFIFDDIYWSQGMKEAWQEIKDHPQVSLTIDLFFIGLVFFRKGREKEHFKVRF